MLKEGKLPIPELTELISFQGAKISGTIILPGIGLDASAINPEIANTYCKKFYDSEDECFLIIKSDPITFSTSNPGKFSIIINANDISCLGGVPYGCTITLLIPPGNSFDIVKKIQCEIHDTCKNIGISILGGHTEITSSVNQIIISLSMIGFVPHNFLPSRVISEGNVLILCGFIGNEGTVILSQEINNKFDKIIFELKEINRLEELLYVGDTALKLNKVLKPLLIHDPTEGGVLGAIYELFRGLENEIGVNIFKNSLDRHIHPFTRKISDLLDIDPLRLISSGALLLIISSDQMDNFKTIIKDFFIPISVIGEVKDKKIMFDDNTPIKPPESDELIQGFKNLEKIIEKNNL
ncbi:MAG: Hydrogenase isoenzymes formation protein HypE [Candidatus Heimdallarchaeota archaeon LC_3]|nr:MAG: Hydrogenase isoenzymes formation protein HypE [Candidatus Heimdallarchaeota archaeon LC_3]